MGPSVSPVAGAARRSHLGPSLNVRQSCHKVCEAHSTLLLLACLAWTPDEKRIAFDKYDARSVNQDIWVMDTARGVTSRLTFDPAAAVVRAADRGRPKQRKNADISTDGKRIVALMPATESKGSQETQNHVAYLENFLDELRRKVPVGK